MADQIIAEVEVYFKNGAKTINMELKSPSEIEDCTEGNVVSLNMINGDDYTGIFKGMDGDNIKIESLSNGYTIGLKTEWVSTYFEEITD